MVDLNKEFAGMVSDFRQFRAAAGQLVTGLSPGETQMMSDMLKTLDQKFAEFEKEFPSAVAALESEKAAMDKRLEDLQKELATIPTTPPDPPLPADPPPPPPVIEKGLGKALREEVLTRFGPVGPPDDELEKEIWEPK